jgi:hypothetical protein
MGKMNPEAKGLWLDALRSGQYKQSHNALKNFPHGYCCLGVLCDISEQGQWDGDGIYYDDQNGYSSSFLPAGVARWAGLDHYDPAVDLGDGEPLQLSYLNDTGLSFAHIAAIIEEYF